MKKALIFLFLFCTLNSYAQHYIFDATFGANGRVIHNDTSYAIESALDSKGNIITVGHKWIRQSFCRAYLTRHDSNGTLDLSFGVNGIVMLPIMDSYIDPRLLVLPDDKIVVVGADQTGGKEIKVVKYLSNGTPDVSFCSGGLYRRAADPAIYYNLSNEEPIAGIYHLPSGKLILAYYDGSNGTVIMRLNKNGTIDTKLGNGGIIAYGRSVELARFIKLNDGNFLGTGYIDGKPGVFKVDSNGNLLQNFGKNGKQTVSLPHYPIFMKGIELPDGKFLLTGEDTLYSYLVRLNKNGLPDSSFGNASLVRVDNYGADIAMLPTGQIVLAGKFNDHRISVYNADGSIDGRFNGWGHFDYDNNCANSRPYHLFVQQDGKIVVSSWGCTSIHGFSLVRMDVSRALDISNIKAPSNEINVFPNPTTGNIVVNMPFSLAELRVTDMAGKTLHAHQRYESGTPLILDIPGGVYRISVFEKNGRTMHAKFIKQ